ncbi:MAG: septation protein IspZ, partial [Nitrosomonas ureae]
LMGGVNLYVAFSFSVDIWVTFKLFGATGMMLVFIILQVMVLGKHLKPVPERIQTVNEQDNLIEKIDNKAGKK